MKFKTILFLALVLLPASYLAVSRRHSPAVPGDLRDAPRDSAVEQLSGSGSPQAVIPDVAVPKSEAVKGESGEAASAAVPGDVCGDGKPRTFRLAPNRDRLLATLAAQKGTDVCTLWNKLSLAEQSLFNMVTTFMGSCDSRLQPPPSKSDETALDHAVTLYSINAPGTPDVTASPVPSMGGACGGFNSNRVFMGFDQAALGAMRVNKWGGSLNPDHKRGYNWWRASNDPGGPHFPFTERGMICWGGGLHPCVMPNAIGPTWHFYANDADVNLEKLSDRRGVCGIKDPHLVEMTIAFNMTHESDPLCGSGRLQELEKREGPGGFDSYVPHDAAGNACSKGQANAASDGGNSHFGLGPDKLNGTCLK
jgi:hypothetical protein